MLEDYMRKLFAIGDVNGDGVLSPVEFADLLSRSGFNLRPQVILKLVKEADVNQDGVIEYDEFIPAMLRLRNAPKSYFDDEPAGVASDMPKWDEVPEAMLEKYLGKLFAIGDSNGDGVLQPQEFLELLTRCGLRFPAEVVLEIFLKADVNGDGVIEYDEFIPAMKAIIASLKEAPAPAPSMPNLADVPPLMLERYLQKLFKVADANGDGVLQPAEFANLLRRSGFGFSEGQIATLIDAADINKDGVIEYSEFVPAMSALLQGDFVQDTAPSTVSNEMPTLADVPPEMLQRYLLKLFRVADTNGDGVLQPSELKRLLQLSGFNISNETVNEIVAEADTNHNGVIEYEEFVPVAMSILKAQEDLAEAYLDSTDEAAARQFLLQGQNEAQVLRNMKKLFLIADEDCSGFLDQREFKNCLTQMGLPLTAAEMSTLMNMVDVNRDGRVSYEEFMPVAFEILVKVVAGKINPKQALSKEAAAPKPRTVPAQGWTAYKNMYQETSPAVDVPTQKVVPVRDNTDVASLEGRVLAVQSRRIIRSKIKDVYARFDSDKDGRLTKAQVTSAFGDAMSRRIMATLQPRDGERVTQYQMRRFFDDECTKAIESGVPEYKFLEGIVQMFESNF
jgi:Ca2+-binding EF-hand superfamily protein